MVAPITPPDGGGTTPVYYPVAGTLSATIDDTGLSAGNYSYRIVARVSTNAPTAGVSLAFSGKVEVDLP